MTSAGEHLHRLRIHRPAAGNRRSGTAGAATVPSGPVFQQPVCILRTAAGPDQSPAVGRGRFVLLYKRVEDGAYQGPRNGQEMQKLSRKEFGWLLDGLKLEHPTVLRKIARRVL